MCISGFNKSCGKGKKREYCLFFLYIASQAENVLSDQPFLSLLCNQQERAEK